MSNPTPSDQTELHRLIIENRSEDGTIALDEQSALAKEIMEWHRKGVAAAEQRARIELVEQLIDAQDQETDLDDRPVGQIYHILGGDDREYLEYVVLPQLKAELEQSLRKEEA